LPLVVACAALAATLLLFWPLVLGQVGFVQANDGICPAAEQVEQRVRGILGLRPADTLEERARLSREGEQLKVVVTRKDGSVLGEKTLGAARCEELEGLVSVVIATWISDVHPEFLATLPTAPSRGEMPAEEPTPREPERPSAPPPNSPTPARVAPPVRLPVAAPVAQRWRFELTAGAGVAVSGGASVLAALGLRWAPERQGLGAALSAHVTTARSEPLSSGHVSYWRWPLVLGPVLRLPLAGVRLDVHAGLGLAWVHATGRDFHPSSTDDALREGGLLGARVTYGRGRFRPFFEVSGAAWAKTQAFVTQEAEGESSAELPSLELDATLGVSWSL
jgi:hypothetical protein